MSDEGSGSFVKKIDSPGDMEIYDAFKWPGGIPSTGWNDLTDEQKKTVLDSYRFSGYKPGTYQGVTFSGRGIACP